MNIWVDFRTCVSFWNQETTFEWWPLHFYCWEEMFTASLHLLHHSSWWRSPFTSNISGSAQDMIYSALFCKYKATYLLNVPVSVTILLSPPSCSLESSDPPQPIPLFSRYCWQHCQEFSTLSHQLHLMLFHHLACGLNRLPASDEYQNILSIYLTSWTKPRRLKNLFAVLLQSSSSTD